MKIFVIGAGVSSLAFCSFLDKFDITVLDSNDFSGRKLLATGNGRCNFTNFNLSRENYLEGKKGFVDYSLKNFSNKDLLDYFEYLGIEWTSMPSGRCYPKTLASKTVRDSLFMKASDNANFIFGEKVEDIDFGKRLIITKDKKFKYDLLIIASGGVTLKNSGSDGSILKILSNHTKINDLTYGITNFNTKNPLSKKAKGTKVSAKASLKLDGKLIKESTDDVIFQSYGLTGTAILDLSNEISINLLRGRKVSLDIDFYPEYKKEGLLKKFQKKAERFPQRTISELLVGNINQKLIIDILKRAKINKDSKNHKDLKKLVDVLKCLSFDITKIHDKENAQVSLGGVSLERIDEKSMKSKDIAHTFFIGEVMDVAGACGGYNIQWAFSSAKTVSDYIKEQMNV